jgi:hypothetical protein
MNNLIYLNLKHLALYDKWLMSDHYQHNKWFKLSQIPLWPPHTTSRVTKLNTPWDLMPTLFPIPAIDHNELNFDHVIESIAEEFCKAVEISGRTPCVCWSGGVDSTSILVSILKVASPEFLQKLVVLMNNQSITENAYFYYNYIEKKLKIVDIDSFVITSENYNQFIIVDGEGGNQCMGQASVQKLLYYQRYDLLDRPWREIQDLTQLLLGADKFSIELIVDSIPYAPVSIDTGYDFLWWLNFNFKFDDVLMRKMPSYTCNLSALETKSFWDKSLYRFYAHPKMQVWSMLTKDVRRESLKITPKNIPKKYIYKFDQNDYYFYNKREEGSQSKLLHSMAIHPVIAIDDTWQKHSLRDKHTRVNLGHLLQRI